MPHKKTLTLLMILSLFVASLACSLPIGEKVTPTPVIVEEPEPIQAEEPTPIPTETQAPVEPPPVTLSSSQIRSEYGGYTCSPITGWEFYEDSYGYVEISPPAATIEKGPIFDINGGKILDGENITLEQMKDVLIGGYKTDKTTYISEWKSITIGDIPGAFVESTWKEGETTLKGKAAIAVVSDDQQFLMNGFSLADEWDQSVGKQFDAVLGSVTFFEPTVTANFDLPEEEEIPQEGGSFNLTIEGDKTTQVDGGEFWATGDNLGYSLNLYPSETEVLMMMIPTDITEGIHNFEPLKFDETVVGKFPLSAFLALNKGNYETTEGLLIVDSFDNQVMTGSFFLEMVEKDNPEKTITVSGEFNQILFITE